MRQALGWDLAPPRTRRPKSSTSSIVRSTRALPIRRSRRGLPNRAALRLRARPPTTASSLPTKPRSGARWSSSRTSNRSDPAPTFHNVRSRNEIEAFHLVEQAPSKRAFSGRNKIPRPFVVQNGPIGASHWIVGDIWHSLTIQKRPKTPGGRLFSLRPPPFREGCCGLILPKVEVSLSVEKSIAYKGLDGAGADLIF